MLSSSNNPYDINWIKLEFLMDKIIILTHQNSTWVTQLNSACMIKARTYVMVFDNEPFSPGVTQLHLRLCLLCNWVTPASTGSLSNTTTLYVLAIIYPPANWVITASGNSLLPILYQAITWTNVDLSSIAPLGTNLGDIWIKTFLLSTKCIWQCHLQIVSHFVMASLCSKSVDII